MGPWKALEKFVVDHVEDALRSERGRRKEEKKDEKKDEKKEDNFNLLSEATKDFGPDFENFRTKLKSAPPYPTLKRPRVQRAWDLDP